MKYVYSLSYGYMYKKRNQLKHIVCSLTLSGPYTDSTQYRLESLLLDLIQRAIFKRKTKPTENYYSRLHVKTFFYFTSLKKKKKCPFHN